MRLLAVPRPPASPRWGCSRWAWRSPTGPTTTRSGPGCPGEAAPWSPTLRSSGSLFSRVRPGVRGPGLQQALLQEGGRAGRHPALRRAVPPLRGAPRPSARPGSGGHARLKAGDPQGEQWGGAPGHFRELRAFQPERAKLRANPELWPSAQCWAGQRWALRLLLARRPVWLHADTVPVHHAGPDRRLAEADLPAAHGEDQAGAGELPALRAGRGAGGRAPGAFSFLPGIY